MADEPSSDIQDQLLEWMEAAQKPQLPLTNTELRKVRLLIDKEEKTAWLVKRIKVSIPWIITVVAGTFAGWKWLVGLIQNHS